MSENQSIEPACFNLSLETLEKLSILQEETGAATLDEAVRNAIIFHYHHVSMETVHGVPLDIQNTINERLMEVMQLLSAEHSMPQHEAFEVYLLLAKDVLIELCRSTGMSTELPSDAVL